MKPWEKIVHEYGRELLDLVLLVYINFYFSELQIIDLCGRWIPRRSILKEKFWLVHHAADEIRHAKQFMKGVELLGLKWVDIPHEKYRLSDIDGRFDKLMESDDELEVLIGLNLYAEGVLAMEELVQLGQYAPHLFPAFPQIVREEQRHLGYGRAVACRLIRESMENRERAQKYCDWYRDHLHQYLWHDISALIDKGIAYGCLHEQYREQIATRFEAVMSSVGLVVSWDDAARGASAHSKSEGKRTEGNILRK